MDGHRDEDDDGERERERRCCRWFIVKIEGLAELSPPGRRGEAACTYVNAWAGHATVRRTGFSSFLLYSELYGCFVVTCSEKERESRGVHRAI